VIRLSLSKPADDSAQAGATSVRRLQVRCNKPPGLRSGGKRTSSLLRGLFTNFPASVYYLPFKSTAYSAGQNPTWIYRTDGYDNLSNL
jgi:hypothetical protein